MEKPTLDPPSYPPPQGQSNPGFQSPPPYAGTQNFAPPPGEPYSQQPGFPGQPQGYVNNTVVYQQPLPVNNVIVTSVDDHMGLAIFATFCCFWPLGIVAILRSCEVRSALAVNDVFRAQRLSEESRRMSRYSIVIGLVIAVVLFILVLILNLSTA